MHDKGECSECSETPGWLASLLVKATAQGYNATTLYYCKVHTGTLLKMPWTTGGMQHEACIGQYGRFRYQPTQNPLFALRVIHANLEAILDTG